MPENEGANHSFISQQNKQLIIESKLQRVIKTLLINISFIALVSKFLIQSVFHKLS